MPSVGNMCHCIRDLLEISVFYSNIIDKCIFYLRHFSLRLILRRDTHKMYLDLSYTDLKLDGPWSFLRSL